MSTRPLDDQSQVLVDVVDRLDREDLLLSKLVWRTESGSAIQLQDAIQLAALDLDWTYVERWAAVLNVAAQVSKVRP